MKIEYIQIACLFLAMLNAFFGNYDTCNIWLATSLIIGAVNMNKGE